MIEIDDIRRLDIHQGDLLVVLIKQCVTNEQYRRAIELLEPFIKPLGAKAIILDNGMTIDVLRNAAE